MAHWVRTQNAVIAVPANHSVLFGWFGLAWLETSQVCVRMEKFFPAQVSRVLTSSAEPHLLLS